MVEPELQFISNEDEATAVIVPIEFWREISSERETAHLLRSPKMRERLLTALHSKDDIPLEAVVEKLRL